VSERWVRIGRWVLALLILVFVVRTFSRNWTDLRAQPVDWTFRAWPAAGSVALVLLMYALLIEAWRRMLRGWGEKLGPLEAARIWLVSSLGKYVPGKVWAIAGMALMAREAGVAAWAATASAILLQGLAVATGAAVAALAGAATIRATDSHLLPLLWLGAALGGLGVAALLWGPLAQRLLQLAHVEDGHARLHRGPILFGAAANVIAWLGYGLAFWLLAWAVLPSPALSPTQAIAGFAASYVAGLVALFAPGGLVVREGLLVALLQGSIGLGPATALALASRVLLTITELGAAAPFLLLHRETSRVA
jgi:hypothetical protein